MQVAASCRLRLSEPLNLLNFNRIYVIHELLSTQFVILTAMTFNLLNGKNTPLTFSLRLNFPSSCLQKFRCVIECSVVSCHFINQHAIQLAPLTRIHNVCTIFLLSTRDTIIFGIYMPYLQCANYVRNPEVCTKTCICYSVCGLRKGIRQGMFERRKSAC